MSIHLFSKLDRTLNLKVETRDMAMIRNVMSYASVSTQIVVRFSSSNGKTIGEKAAKDVADKLEQFLPKIKPNETKMRRKLIINDKVETQTVVLTNIDLALIRNFIIFNRLQAPYEIY